MSATNEDNYLEICVTEDVGGAVKVLDLLERTHDFRPDHASLFIHQLNGRSLSVVSHAIAHHHVKLVLVVFNTENHGHGLADFNDAGYF